MSVHPSICPSVTPNLSNFLTKFLMLDLDETFSNAPLGYYEYLDTISNSIKSIHVFQDFRKRLGG